MKVSYIHCFLISLIIGLLLYTEPILLMEGALGDLDEGASLTLNDALENLPEGLQKTFDGSFRDIITTNFEGVSETDLEVLSGKSDQIFENLGNQLKDIVGDSETLTVEQTESVVSALKDSVQELKESLPTEEAGKINDTAITKAFDNLEDEVTAQASDFERPTETLQPSGTKEETELTTAQKNENVENNIEKTAGEEEGEEEGEEKEKKKPESWVKRAGRFVAENLLMTMVSGFIFMFPQWIVSAIQAALTRQAELATIRSPQYFGGLWLKIPEPLIDTGNLANTNYVYSLIQSPDVSKALSRNFLVTPPFLPIDNANFFVTSGNYDNCTWPFSWGAGGITSNTFASQMIHLNSGLEFLGGGDPLNIQNPGRQLVPQGATDSLHGCKETIASFLYTAGNKIEAGDPFSETYDMFSGTGMITTHSRLPGGTSGKSDKHYFQSLGQLFANNNGSALFSTATNAIPGLLRETPLSFLSSSSAFDTMSQIFTVGAPVVRGQDGTKISGGFSLQIMQQPDKSLGSVIAGATYGGTLFNQALNAQGMYIYQTADTRWALQARRYFKAQASPGFTQALNHIFDYVVCLDGNGNYIAGYVPYVAASPEGPNSAQGTVKWGLDPQVNYLYSLIDNSLFNVKKLAVESNSTLLKQAQNQVNQSNASLQSAPWSFFTALAQGLVSGLAQGPFTYGGYTLSTLPDLAGSPVALYACKPENNNKKTTLENGGTDYFVPLDTNFNPISLPNPSSLKYFISVVSSRIYTPDLTLVNDIASFALVIVPSMVSSFVVRTSLLQDFIGKNTGSTIACQGCDGLETPLGTLYQEYDLNPFNADRLSIFADLSRAIAASISSSTNAVYQSAIQTGVLGRIAVFAATRLVSSLQGIGLTPVIIDGLNGLWGSQKSAMITAIGTVLANRITQVFEQGLQEGRIQTSLDKASPTDLETLLTATSNADAIKTAFSQIGTVTLKDKLTPAAQTIFDDLATEMGTADSGQPYSVILAKNRLIGVGALFPYELGLNLVMVDGKPRLLGSYLNQNKPTVDQAIRAAHFAWKLWLMGRDQSQWLLYQQMGPFAFTSQLLPNVIIEATSLDDIQQGDFVYQSSSYPGDYFVVASSISATGTISGIEAFDPADPQPYLISLVTGTIYERSPDAVTIVTASDGSPLRLANLDAIRQSIKSTSLRNQLGLLAQTAPTSLWKRYTYANFLLTIDPQDVKNNTFVYQDITTVTDFPPSLGQINDFFVGANYDNNALTVGIPLENNPSYIISVVTGTFYSNQGQASLSLPASMSPGNLLGNLKGGAVREPLRSAIGILIKKQAAAQAAEEKETGTTPVATGPHLDQSIITQLMSSAIPYVPSPYAFLKFFNSKYYGVMGASNDPRATTLQTIFDYSLAKGETESGGFLYDGQGNPLSFYDESLLAIARAKAGVVVNPDGSQVLGVPNTAPSLTLGSQVSMQPLGLTTTIGSTAYSLLEYNNTQMPGLRVLAQARPATPESSYYIDMFSGAEFATDGTSRIASNPVLVNATGQRVGFIGNDARGMPQVFGVGTGGYYYQYSYYRNFSAAVQYLGFQAVGDDKQLLAISPTQLDSSVPWEVKPGEVKSITNPNTGEETPTNSFVSGGTFKTPSGSAQEYMRTYEYIGTSASSTTVFEGPKTTTNPNYAASKLVVSGARENGGYSTLRLFITSSIPSLTSVGMPLGSYVECQASGQATGTTGTRLNAVALPDGKTPDYSAVFYDNLIDGKTGARYAALQDNAGTHFYIPNYQQTDASTLRSIQTATQAYVSLTAYGDVGLFKPLPNLVNLQPIQAVVGVPTSQISAVQSLISSGQFLYDPSQMRYLYKYAPADAGQLYYIALSPAAAYVDLRFGVLYDATGIPLGPSLNYGQLRLLLQDKNVAIPRISIVNGQSKSDDPTKYKPSPGFTTVPQGVSLTPTTPFLKYTG